MMKASVFKDALVRSMQAHLDAKKAIQTIPNSNTRIDGENVVVTSNVTTADMHLGKGGSGKVMNLDPVQAEADMINALAEAIAEEMITFLKTYMEIRGDSGIFEVDSKGKNVQ